MNHAISISSLNKVYSNGHKALQNINLDVKKGEIFALLGPNGAGKTTLISTVCGIVNASSGSIKVMGFDNRADYRAARKHIGLVPQELTTDAFETVWNTVSFSRELFGKAANPAYIAELLKRLSLIDKKDSQLRTLSGGMKRRVMIAKALSHEPDILFLDEPTAGVDVELRKSMWEQVRELRETGVTVILTTHYIEEAEEMADRVGVINKGQLVEIDSKNTLMKKFGKKELIIKTCQPVEQLPENLSEYNLQLLEAEDSSEIIFTYDPSKENNKISKLLDKIKQNNILYKDLDTRQSSLEEIFVKLIG
jgi:ABC-2 type transport system ATP-binding protein